MDADLHKIKRSRYAPEIMKPLVVLPTINEKDNILEIVPEILKFKEAFCVLVVDDNSSDGTQDAVRELAGKNPDRVFLLERLKSKRGLGRAYIDGFKWALAKDYDYIFEMDADFSHDPKYLPVLLEKMKDADVAIGSRYYKGRISVINWDLKRVWLSTMGNIYARIITGVPVSDCTAGFKCFKRKVLECIDLNRIVSEGYSFQMEMNWRAHRAGFKIEEIPIIFYERRHGESKLSRGIIKEALWVLWKMRLRP